MERVGGRNNCLPSHSKSLPRQLSVVLCHSVPTLSISASQMVAPGASKKPAPGGLQQRTEIPHVLYARLSCLSSFCESEDLLFVRGALSRRFPLNVPEDLACFSE